MTTREIAERLVALCRAGKFVEAITELYAPDVQQSENGAPPSVGRDGLVRACQGWLDSRVLHSMQLLGTHIADDAFVLELKYDVTPHSTQQRYQWAEAGVYRVRNGRITDVRFYYQPPAA